MWTTIAAYLQTLTETERTAILSQNPNPATQPDPAAAGAPAPDYPPSRPMEEAEG